MSTCSRNGVQTAITALLLLQQYTVANTILPNGNNARYLGTDEGITPPTSILNTAPPRIRKLRSNTNTYATAFWGDGDTQVVQQKEGSKHGSKYSKIRQVLRQEEERKQDASLHSEFIENHENTSYSRSLPSITRADFVRGCEEYLLSESIIDDNIITEEEIADFYSTYCVDFQILTQSSEFVCVGTDEFDFHNIPIEIQLQFILALCPEGPDFNTCMDGIEEKTDYNIPVGFEITDENMAEVQNDVDSFCNAMFPPTEAPTKQPTTTAPTKTPTRQPTTTAPTTAPTRQPTTTAPTTDPTKQSPTIATPTIQRSVPGDTNFNVELGPDDGTEGNNLYKAAGYSIAGVLMFLLGAYVSRRGWLNEGKNQDPPSSDDGNSYTAVDPPRSVGLLGLRGIAEEEEEEDSHVNHEDVVQFDPKSIATNAAFSFPIKNSASFYSVSDSSSNDDFFFDDDEDKIKVQLDDAMHAGDWNAVASLAREISAVESDEEDSMVSNSQLSQEKELSYEIGSMRQNHSMEDAQRAAKIDKLIAQEDWDAVSFTAASFDNEVDVIDTDISSGESDNIQSIRGRRLYLPTEQVQMNTDSSETSSLSNASHDNRYGGAALGDDQISGTISNSLGVDVGVGTNVKTFATMPLPSSNSSSESDNERKAILSTNMSKSDTNNGQKSRWSMFFRKDTKEEPSERSDLALQEDSSGASSWTHSSDEENVVLDPYGNGEKDRKSPMQTEIEAFGTGYGLAAAESAFHDNYCSDDSVNRTTSVNSKESLHDALDRAIETGDWTGVENQTNRIFETVDEEAPQRSVGSSSRSLSYHDAGSNDCWSSAEDGDGELSIGLSIDSSTVDDDNIETLERLIENDDWQGIVTVNPIYNQNEDSTTASSAIEFSTMSDYQDAAENTSDFIEQDEIWNSITNRAI